MHLLVRSVGLYIGVVVGIDQPVSRVQTCDNRMADQDVLGAHIFITADEDCLQQTSDAVIMATLRVYSTRQTASESGRLQTLRQAWPLVRWISMSLYEANAIAL